MMKGVLWKSTETYAGALERRYCVLVGTLMLDFESEDDFLCGAPPRAEAQVIGASGWKGKGRPRGAHKDGFVYVTRLGRTNYCCAPSKTALGEWMHGMRTALDMALGTEGVRMEPEEAGGIAVYRDALHRGLLEPPAPVSSEVCSKSGLAFGLTQSRYNCTSCGLAFALEHCNQRVPLSHHGFEEAVRVCDDCLAAQQLVTHLRFLSCTLDAHLHQQKLTRRGVRPAVVRSLGRDSEDGQKILASSLEVGLDLLEKGELSEEEFSGLVKAEEGFQQDEAYNRVHAGCLAASARLGDSTLAVVGLLHKGASIAPANEFRAVVLHLRMLAEKDLDSIDFFWPQVLHAFYLLVPTVTAEGVFKAEMLEDFILSMALRSTHLSLKLVWWLKGYANDLGSDTANATGGGKGASGKQAHLVRLAVEVEDIVLSRADHAMKSRRGPRHPSSATTCEQLDHTPSGDQETRFTAESPATSTVNASVGSETPASAERPLISAPAAGDEPAVSPSFSGQSGTVASPPRLPPATIRAEGVVRSETPRTGLSPRDTASTLGTNGELSPGCARDAQCSRNTLSGDENEDPHLPFERSLLKTLVRPTGAQSCLVGDELLLLRALRVSAASQLGLDYEAKTLFYSWAAQQTAKGEEERGEAGRAGAGRVDYADGWAEARYFEEQLAFVQSLVDIAERLRFVEPVSARGDHLKKELEILGGEEEAGMQGSGENDGNRSPGDDDKPSGNSGSGGGHSSGNSSYHSVVGDSAVEVVPRECAAERGKNECVEEGFGSLGKAEEGRRKARRCGRGARGYLPVCRATEPICPIVRIPPGEGHVFKTKQRAPTLITCEVLIPQQQQQQQQQEEQGQYRRRRSRRVSMPPAAEDGRELRTEANPTKSLQGSNQADGSGASSKGGDGEKTWSRSPQSLADATWDGARGEGSSPGRGSGGLVASPLVTRKAVSRGSDREEVEEMIGSQVGIQGSMARSISVKTETPGHRSQPPPPSAATDPPEHPLPLRQRAHSDPPLFSRMRSAAEGRDLGGRHRRPGSSSSSREKFRPPALLAARLAAVTAAAVTDISGNGSERSLSRSRGVAAVQSTRDAGAREFESKFDVDDASPVYPEVWEAVGFPPLRSEATSPVALPSDVNDSGEDNGQIATTAVDAASGASEARRLPAAPEPPVGREGPVDESHTVHPPASADSVVANLSADEGLALPVPAKEAGLIGDEHISDVEDVLRSHRGHELLRHSPLRKETDSGGGGGGGGRGTPLVRRPPWDDASRGRETAPRQRKTMEGVKRLAESDNVTDGVGAVPLGEGAGDVSAMRNDTAAVGSGNGEGERGRASRNDEGPRLQAIEALLRSRSGEESAAVSQAKALLAQGLISEDELEAVVKKDLAFTEVVEQHAFLDVQFCVSQAFGESWASKRARIKAASADGGEPGWDLVSIIVKSNDDLRQEVCALQLIGLCQRIFAEARLELFLHPYVIVSTGSSSGLVQCLTDAISVDSLKKNPGFVSLRDHFERTYGEPTSRRFLEAQRNFVNSLAAYSLASYVLQIKDRHNGNILLDAEGHLIHIDFGFILGMAPGGNFSVETCPFKLPTDYLDVMGGLDSQAFMDLVVAFTCGFLTLQAHVGRLVKLLSMMTQKSPFPCFQGKDSPTNIVKKLSDRLMPHLDKSETVAFCLDLIRESYNNYGMRQYEYFQWLTNGIVT